MDEPMPNTPRYGPEGDAPASLYGEDEWSTELARLAARLEGELREVTARAIQDASSCVGDLKQRGTQQLRLIEESRRSAEEEAQAMLARVADLRANIATVEREVEEERVRAEDEAEAIMDEARHRAEPIIADAEARAADMLASAHSEAASRRAIPSARRSASGADLDTENRLRGLSTRVGLLLETGATRPTPAAPPVAPSDAQTPPLDPAADSEATSSADDRSDEEPDEEPTRMVDIDSTPTIEARPSEAQPVQDEPAEPAVRRMAEFARPVTLPTRDEEEDDRPAASDEPQRPTIGESEDVDDYRPVAPRPIAAEPAPIRPSSTSVSATAGGPVIQAVIFQAVPNFQAALALERSLKAVPGVREVRVADFDEQQLTFQETHELGDQLAQVILTQRDSELQLVDARADRIELAFRACGRWGGPESCSRASRDSEAEGGR